MTARDRSAGVTIQYQQNKPIKGQNQQIDMSQLNGSNLVDVSNTARDDQLMMMLMVNPQSIENLQHQQSKKKINKKLVGATAKFRRNYISNNNGGGIVVNQQLNNSNIVTQRDFSTKRSRQMESTVSNANSTSQTIQNSTISPRPLPSSNLNVTTNNIKNLYEQQKLNKNKNNNQGKQKLLNQTYCNATANNERLQMNFVDNQQVSCGINVTVQSSHHTNNNNSTLQQTNTLQNGYNRASKMQQKVSNISTIQTNKEGGVGGVVSQSPVSSRSTQQQLQQQQQQMLRNGGNGISQNKIKHKLKNNPPIILADSDPHYYTNITNNTNNNTNIIVGITPKQKDMMNGAQQRWTNMGGAGSLIENPVLQTRRTNYAQIKDIYTNATNTNMNTQRGGGISINNDKKQKISIHNNLLETINQNINTSTNGQAQQIQLNQKYSLTPKRKDININIKVQQFPPVQYIADAQELQLYQNIVRAREGVLAEKRNQNKTTQDIVAAQSTKAQMMKTVDFISINNNHSSYAKESGRDGGGVVDPQKSVRSGSTINTSKDLQSSQLGGVGNIQLKKKMIGQQQSFKKQLKKDDQTSEQKIQFPMNSQQTIKAFANNLSNFEKEEILQYEQIYFVNLNPKRKMHNMNLSTLSNENNNIKNQDEEDESKNLNFGFDNDQGDYLFEINDHINYRYEIIKRLGKGAFGVVLKCFDHKNKEYIALKILKNRKKLHKQGKIEVKILTLLRDQDIEDKKNIIIIKDSFTFRSHVCICFELLSINLYQFIKENEFQGFSSGLTKRFAIQILISLSYMYEHTIVHCDLKPENILLKKPNKAQIKLIDFGSSCFESERYYTYIQSRFYRAPEIMLGIPYTTAIDMWSFGCIIYECLTGIPIFTGENERDQMCAIMEIIGLPPRSLIAKATRRKVFFDDDYNPIIKPNSRGKIRKPGSKPLNQLLTTNDTDLIEFLKGCFEWKPEVRMKPYQALMTPWIQKAITESRLKQQIKNGGGAGVAMNSSILENNEGCDITIEQQHLQKQVNQSQKMPQIVLSDIEQHHNHHQ